MNNSIFADGAGYVRGRFVPIAEAVLPVTDWGFTRSDVVYDVVHVFKGGFFRLADHLDRFERSMAQRRIRPPEDRTAIEAILHRCVALTGLIDAYVAERVRAARIKSGMSQAKLGDLVGVTFQQIQKYENGINRISAGRLYQISADDNVRRLIMF